MSHRSSVRSVAAGLLAATACVLAPSSAAAIEPVSKPLANCATKVPSRPAVSGVKVRPGVVSVRNYYASGNISWNITSPTPEGEDATVVFGVYEWGIRSFGILYATTEGCTANTFATAAVHGLEKSGGPVEWKPNTLYTVYVLARFTESNPWPGQPGVITNWFGDNPLLRAPASAFFTKALKGDLPSGV